MSLGGYPLGADYDPRAPWNQKEPTMVKCEACNGKGKHWYAYNIEENTETECTKPHGTLCPRQRNLQTQQEATI